MFESKTGEKVRDLDPLFPMQRGDFKEALAHCKDVSEAIAMLVDARTIFNEGAQAIEGGPGANAIDSNFYAFASNSEFSPYYYRNLFIILLRAGYTALDKESIRNHYRRLLDMQRERILPSERANFINLVDDALEKAFGPTYH